MNPIIATFKEEFDRFYGFMGQQVDICPDELWAGKESGYIYWMQLYHTIAIIELNAIVDGEKPLNQFGMDVLMFNKDPEKHLTKTEFKEYASKVKVLADRFIENMTVEKLSEKHDAMSKMLGKTVTNQSVLMSMIRHACYHIGCCDAALRSKGLKGVY